LETFSQARQLTKDFPIDLKLRPKKMSQLGY